MQTVTILVVSRTPKLLNRMLASLDDSFSGDSRGLKIICSWNGSLEEEDKIENKSRFEFLIAQREPYHFASNMNRLATLATGEILILVNDDLILKSKAIDFAIQALIQHNAGVAGIRLATTSGEVGHAGIHFDQNHTPYHRLDRLTNASDPRVLISGPTAAVTGAFMAISRDDFTKLGGFNTGYKTCCEDVELCLRTRSELKKQVWYCSEAQGIHDGEATRRAFEATQRTSEDITLIRKFRETWLQTASTTDLRLELRLAATEADDLRSIHRETKESAAQADSKQHEPGQNQSELNKYLDQREALLRNKSKSLQKQALKSIGAPVE